jgi:CheY-like chemotaxis protein
MKPRGNEQPLVLVVDDQQSVLDDVAEMFGRANFACQCCIAPDEALAAVRTSTPDLILCDVSVQGQSGFELCRLIRQQPGLSDTPVMFLSSAQLPDIVRRSYAARGTYCLRKPIDPDVLLELIDQAMGVAQG